MFETSLVRYLRDQAPVSSIIGGVSAQRIFPLMIPQHAKGEEPKVPCIVYGLVANSRIATFCGTEGLVFANYQLDCYSLRYVGVSSAKELAMAVRNALVDYSGMMYDTRINRITLGTETDLLDPDPGLYRVLQTYSVIYYE